MTASQIMQANATIIFTKQAEVQRETNTTSKAVALIKKHNVGNLNDACYEEARKWWIKNHVNA